jgi:murein L,D-transpeptidase YafK
MAEPAPELQLKTAVEQIVQGQRREAERMLEQVMQRAPSLDLARALHTELLAGRDPVVVAPPLRLASANTNLRLQELVEEAQLRLSPPKVPAGSLPDSLLQLSTRQRYAVVVDLPRARLYVLENTPQGLKLVREHYAAMGRNGVGKQSRGDLRTPIGIYTITGFTPDSALPEKYGSGAFPLTYPNIWDRHHGRDGSGIWLHGVPPGMSARAPRSSEGCVTMGNADLVSLKPYLTVGQTPVVLADSLSWLPAKVLAQQRDTLLARIEAWRSRWSAIDTEGYLDFYADEFTTSGMNKAAFSAYKRRVNASKKRIDVQLSDIDLLRYPGEPNLVMAQFRQGYKSDNFSASSIKQQFWRQQKDGSWKIVMEES